MSKIEEILKGLAEESEEFEAGPTAAPPNDLAERVSLLEDMVMRQCRTIEALIDLGKLHELYTIDTIEIAIANVKEYDEIPTNNKNIFDQRLKGLKAKLRAYAANKRLR